MGEVFQNFGPGGGRCSDLQYFLQDVFPVKPLVWVRNLSDDPQNQFYPRRLLPQVGALLEWDAITARFFGAVEVPASGGGDGVRNT